MTRFHFLIKLVSNTHEILNYSQKCALLFERSTDTERDGSSVAFHLTDLLANSVNLKIHT